MNACELAKLSRYVIRLQFRAPVHERSNCRSFIDCLEAKCTRRNVQQIQYSRQTQKHVRICIGNDREIGDTL
jgi:hypothetical protein